MKSKILNQMDEKVGPNIHFTFTFTNHTTIVNK